MKHKSLFYGLLVSMYLLMPAMAAAQSEDDYNQVTLHGVPVSDNCSQMGIDSSIDISITVEIPATRNGDDAHMIDVHGMTLSRWIHFGQGGLSNECTFYDSRPNQIQIDGIPNKLAMSWMAISTQYQHGTHKCQQDKMDANFMVSDTEQPDLGVCNIALVGYIPQQPH